MHNLLNKPRDTTQLHIAGPISFRLGSRKVLSSHRDTPWNNFGGNRQNLEKSMRRIWIADDGYNIIHRDQSGAEALIVAYLCRAGKYRSLFEYSIKPHTYMALILFPDQWKKRIEKPEHIDWCLKASIKELKNFEFWPTLASLIKSSDDWPASERYYFMGKGTIHMSSYGGREKKLQEKLLKDSNGAVVISLKEAARFQQTFHEFAPEIYEWHSRLYESARRTGQLRNLFGHPLNITWQFKQEDMRDLIAWIPQSTVGEITNIAYAEMQEYIEDMNKNWHMMFTMHDSLDSQAPEPETTECSNTMKQFLEKEFTSPFDGTIFRMKSECAVGKNLAPYDKVTNPLGLKEVK